MIDSEHKFLQALDKCIALADMKAKASSLPYEAIELFCEISPDGVTTIGKPLTACGVYRLLSKKKRSAILKKT